MAAMSSPPPAPVLARFNPAQPGAAGMKAAATGLLVVMAAIFIVARHFEHAYPWVAYVKAFAEAAMVGGLADWFAVTALFRHPLGLPIPHTAIIPRNKDRIGDALANFLQQNFLVAPVVARRMRNMDVAGAVGRFLQSPQGEETRIRRGASRLIADLFESLDDERLGGLVKTSIANRVCKMEVSPLLGHALASAINEDRHVPMLEAATGCTPGGIQGGGEQWLKAIADQVPTIKKRNQDLGFTWQSGQRPQPDKKGHIATTMEWARKLSADDIKVLRGEAPYSEKVPNVDEGFTEADMKDPQKAAAIRKVIQARLAKEVWDYERYAGHRVWEGARGTNGRTFPFWQRHRYTRSQTFPRLHVVLAGKEEHLLDNRLQALADDVQGIAVAVWVNTLPRLQRGEPWYEIGVYDPDRRRRRYPEPVGR